MTFGCRNPAFGLILALPILSLQPTITFAAPTVTQVAAGNDHTVFVESDGSLWGMGLNANGQLGDGTTNSHYLPIMIVPSNVVSVAAGSAHTIFLKSDGNLWAVGANGHGQLGDGTTFEQHVPEQITFSGGVTFIAAGGEHSLFLKGNSLWGMGRNDDGQLGTGNNQDVHAATQLSLAAVYRIACGYAHSLYETTDGSLWGMGLNQLGALGDGTSSTRYTPVEVVTNHSVFSGVSGIAGGWLHSLYLFSGPGAPGSLWAMGDNLTGDVGDGSGATRYSPVEILTTGVNAIAGGYGFSLFVKSDGSLWAMGSDLDGQLGDGNSGQFAESLVPERIVTTNVTAVATGTGHSLFIKSDGSLWGMGYNGNGELGDGTPNNTAIPERIIPRRQLVLNHINVSGADVQLDGTNDFFGGSVVVWSTINLSLPLSQWTPVWTNGVGSGAFSFTAINAVDPEFPLRFYRLQLFQIQ